MFLTNGLLPLQIIKEREDPDFRKKEKSFLSRLDQEELEILRDPEEFIEKTKRDIDDCKIKND